MYKRQGRERGRERERLRERDRDRERGTQRDRQTDRQPTDREREGGQTEREREYTKMKRDKRGYNVSQGFVQHAQGPFQPLATRTWKAWSGRVQKEEEEGYTYTPRYPVAS